MKTWASTLILFWGCFAAAQSKDDFDIEAELNAAEGRPAVQNPTATPPAQAQPSLIPKPEISTSKTAPTSPDSFAFPSSTPNSTPKLSPSEPSAPPAGSPPPPEIISTVPSEPVETPKVEPIRISPKGKPASVDEELRVQNQIIERKMKDQGQISNDRNVDRYPKADPIFVKPPGPKQGGTVRVEHPRAADGLIRINRDGSYQYRTALKEKSQSGSFKVGMMTPPTVTTDTPDLSYESMYGDGEIFSVEMDYVWQPFRQFGALGLRIGTGFATASGDGFFKTPRSGAISRAQESYTLFIVPISAFLEYRFEYMRKQWLVPFVAGGGTYYGLAELRDDGRSPTFAGSPAVGGGGGLMFSISRLDPEGAFTLSQEYGIADMWFVVEAKAMQGLNPDLDFTNQTISAGISVDF